MKKETQITVIVPIHKYDDTVKVFLNRALESVDKESFDVLFVGPNEVLNEAKKLYEDATLVVNEETDVYTQINKAALQCVTPYFTVLEFDDILLPNWKTQLVSEIGENTITIPLNEYVENGEFRAFGNEIAWDAAFIHEDGNLGFITEDELKAFSDFNITGAIIKTEDFISLGKLNPDFKILSWYEFLMRVARADKTIYVVPRVCYSHTVLRDGSYGAEARKTTDKEEISKLFEQILGKEK